MPIRGVSELTLEVVDLGRSVQFYAEVLGLPVVERWEDRGVFWVMAGERTRIGLWEPQVGLAGGRGGIHVHYALYIDEDSFDEVVERLRAWGTTWRSTRIVVALCMSMTQTGTLSNSGRGMWRAEPMKDPSSRRQTR